MGGAVFPSPARKGTSVEFHDENPGTHRWQDQPAGGRTTIVYDSMAGLEYSANPLFPERQKASIDRPLCLRTNMVYDTGPVVDGPSVVREKGGLS
jgi:hypothetical protein